MGGADLRNAKHVIALGTGPASVSGGASRSHWGAGPAWRGKWASRRPVGSASTSTAPKCPGSAHSRTLVVPAEMLVGERKQVPGMADEGGHVAAQNDGGSRG